MKSKKINEIFNIEKGNIISIVGSGGKTTLMFELSKKLKENHKILVTTSTKIYKPSKIDYDYLYTNINDYINRNSYNDKPSVTVISNNIDLINNKLVGLNEETLNNLINDFDITLIEADGSRNLPIKGWKNNEPNVPLCTNKTIGVIPIDIINRKADKNIVYGIEEFKEIIGDISYIDFEAIGRICSDKLGIFKNSKGKLYLYINKADTKQLVAETLKLAEYLKKNVVNNPYNFEICFGTLDKGEFYGY